MTAPGRSASSFGASEGSIALTRRLLASLLGDGCADLRVEVYDGTVVGPAVAATTVRIVSPDFFHRIITGRGSELAFCRAYVAGDVEIDGDLYGLLRLRHQIGRAAPRRGTLRAAAQILGIHGADDLMKLRP